MPTRTLYFDSNFADKKWAGRHYTLDAPDGDTCKGRPGEWILGRHPACELTIDIPNVSAKHAAISYSYASSRWNVTDLGSTNHTYLNGEPLQKGDPVPLEIGHKLYLASNCIHVTEDEHDTINDDDDGPTT